MRRRSTSLWPAVLATTLTLSTLAATGLEAASLRIPAGHDLFVTPADGRTYFYLAASSAQPIPRGFFGCVQTRSGCLPSDPIEIPVRVNFRGLPTGPLGQQASPFGSEPCKTVSDPQKFGVHCSDGANNFQSTSPNQQQPLDAVDTIVFRNGDLVLDAIGSVGTIPIELVSLSLESIEPILVRYGNGQATQRFQVKAIGPRTPGRLGSMSVKRSGESSGVYFSTLPVSVRISFHNTSSSGPSALAPFDLELELRGSDIAWRYGG